MPSTQPSSSNSPRAVRTRSSRINSSKRTKVVPDGRNEQVDVLRDPAKGHRSLYGLDEAKEVQGQRARLDHRAPPRASRQSCQVTTRTMPTSVTAADTTFTTKLAMNSLNAVTSPSTRLTNSPGLVRRWELRSHARTWRARSDRSSLVIVQARSAEAAPSAVMTDEDTLSCHPCEVSANAH